MSQYEHELAELRLQVEMYSRLVALGEQQRREAIHGAPTFPPPTSLAESTAANHARHAYLVELQERFDEKRAAIQADYEARLAALQAFHAEQPE